MQVIFENSNMVVIAKQELRIVSFTDNTFKLFLIDHPEHHYRQKILVE